MLITTCPQCHAKFRVTEQHLSAADGLVVCSRCRSIFQAKGTLQKIGETKPKTIERPVHKASTPIFGSTIRSGRDRNTIPPATDAPPSPCPNNETENNASVAPFPPIDTTATTDTASAEAKPSFFARLFPSLFASGQKREPATNPTSEDDDATVTYTPANENPAGTAPLIAANPAETTVTTTDKDATTAPPQNHATEAQTASSAEEFAAVPEPSPETTALLEDKAQQTFLPGARSEAAPAPYDPRFDPRLYPPPPTREEMNWTMASIVALIVLVIQLFYIILQK